MGWEEMYKEDMGECGLYIAQMEGLLETLCENLTYSSVPLPPELLDWWEGYKKQDSPAEG